MSKSKANSNDRSLIAPSGGPVSLNEDLKSAMGSLHRSDRLETMSYALEVALEAGTQKQGPFNLDAAVGALSGGYITLKGNAGQIDAQLKLIEGVCVLLKKVCSTQELAQALTAGERVETLVYAFDQALLAGHADNGFYADRAVQALLGGNLELTGSPAQIQSKIVLVQSAARLIERACQYEMSDERPPKAMHYLRRDRYKAIEKTAQEAAQAGADRDKMMYNAGYKAGKHGANFDDPKPT